MSDTPTAEGTETGPEANDQEQQQKPTETVDFWKQKAREQETRAKANAAAAKKLQELEDAQKTDAQRHAEKLAKADAAIAGIPSQVADALRAHLVDLHKIDAEDAELFLTATDPELLLKQVARLVGQSGSKQQPNNVPDEGRNTGTPSEGDEKVLVNQFFDAAKAL